MPDAMGDLFTRGNFQPKYSKQDSLTPANDTFGTNRANAPIYNIYQGNLSQQNNNPLANIPQFQDVSGNVNGINTGNTGVNLANDIVGNVNNLNDPLIDIPPAPTNQTPGNQDPGTYQQSGDYKRSGDYGDRNDYKQDANEDYSYGPLNRLFRWGGSGLKKESEADFYKRESG